MVFVTSKMMKLREASIQLRATAICIYLVTATSHYVRPASFHRRYPFVFGRYLKAPIILIDHPCVVFSSTSLLWGREKRSCPVDGSTRRQMMMKYVSNFHIKVIHFPSYSPDRAALSIARDRTCQSCEIISHISASVNQIRNPITLTFRSE